jgi:hypothetical protein
VDWAAITAIGTVLAGLALPLAFIQLGALRQDRLREQVSKIGAWTDANRVDEGSSDWRIALFIRNSSELPVEARKAELTTQVRGYQTLSQAVADKPPKAGAYKEGSKLPFTHVPGTIPPGETWHAEHYHHSGETFSISIPPLVTITQVAVTDAAGIQWDIRPYKSGPPLRVRWWRRWWRKRQGDPLR